MRSNAKINNFSFRNFNFNILIPQKNFLSRSVNFEIITNAGDPLNIARNSPSHAHKLTKLRFWHFKVKDNNNNTNNTMGLLRRRLVRPSTTTNTGGGRGGGRTPTRNHKPNKPPKKLPRLVRLLLILVVYGVWALYAVHTRPQLKAQLHHRFRQVWQGKTAVWDLVAFHHGPSTTTNPPNHPHPPQDQEPPAPRLRIPCGFILASDDDGSMDWPDDTVNVYPVTTCLDTSNTLDGITRLKQRVVTQQYPDQLSPLVKVVSMEALQFIPTRSLVLRLGSRAATILDVPVLYLIRDDIKDSKNNVEDHACDLILGQQFLSDHFAVFNQDELVLSTHSKYIIEQVPGPGGRFEKNSVLVPYLRNRSNPPDFSKLE